MCLKLFCTALIVTGTQASVAYCARNPEEARELRLLLSSYDDAILHCDSRSIGSIQKSARELGEFIRRQAKNVDEKGRQNLDKIQIGITRIIGGSSICGQGSEVSFSQLAQLRRDVMELTGRPALPDQQPNYNLGKDVYLRHCASCHGSGGKGDGPLAKRIGAVLPDWSDANSLARVSIAMHFNWLLAGKGKAMPSYRDVLEASEFWSVLFYVQTLPYASIEVRPVVDSAKAKAGFVPVRKRPNTYDMVYLTNQELTSNLEINLAIMRTILPYAKQNE